MATKRTPIDRPPRTPITPEAIRLFEAMKRIKCTCEPRDWDGKYWEHELCAGCEERNRLRRNLHQELRLKPWERTVMAPDAPNPWPAGSPAHEKGKYDAAPIGRSGMGNVMGKN